VNFHLKKMSLYAPFDGDDTAVEGMPDGQPACMYQTFDSVHGVVDRLVDLSLTTTPETAPAESVPGVSAYTVFDGEAGSARSAYDAIDPSLSSPAAAAETEFSPGQHPGPHTSGFLRSQATLQRLSQASRERASDEAVWRFGGSTHTVVEPGDAAAAAAAATPLSAPGSETRPDVVALMKQGRAWNEGVVLVLCVVAVVASCVHRVPTAAGALPLGHQRA
jgi:hypothetical protein